MGIISGQSRLNRGKIKFNFFGARKIMPYLRPIFNKDVWTSNP